MGDEKKVMLERLNSEIDVLEISLVTLRSLRDDMEDNGLSCEHIDMRIKGIEELIDFKKSFRLDVYRNWNDNASHSKLFKYVLIIMICLWIGGVLFFVFAKI